MTWPLPAPGDITARAAALYEAEFARIYLLRNPGAAPPVVDARSPNSTLAVHARQIELGVWDTYLYQSRLALEVMPDTAQEYLSRHGTVWGVPQDQPVASSGFVTVAGVPDVLVPAGLTMSAPTGQLYITTAAVLITGTRVASLPVSAIVPGLPGDLAPATVLDLVSGFVGINPQTATVAGDGITGGRDIEDTESWRLRILQRIRQRGGGGTLSDYQQWAGEVLQGALVGQVSTPGIVNVILAVALPGQPPRVPTATELATVTAYLQDATNRKPLGMTVLVTPATLVPVPVTLAMNPDATDIRAAATAALGAYFNADAAIGGTLHMSRLDAAVSNASGETSHDRTLPAADDITYGPTQLPVLGVVTFA